MQSKRGFRSGHTAYYILELLLRKRIFIVIHIRPSN